MASHVMTAQKHTDWASFFLGVLVAITGVLVLSWPGLTLVMLAEIAGIWLLVAAGFGFASWARARKEVKGAGWTLASAICDAILGLMFLIHPLVAASVIPMLAGCFVLVYGIFALGLGVGMRSITGSGWGIMMLNGVIAILCGILFVLFPAFFAMYLGIFLIMRGITISVLSVSAPDESTFM